MAQVTEVCEELDKVLLEFMSTLQELSQLREQYSAVVKEGYFTMAKARSSMGGFTSVSSLQYDSVMSPLVHVTTSNEPDSYDDKDVQKLSLEGVPVEFKVDRIQPGKVSVPKQAESSKEVGELRKRKGGSAGVEDVPPKEAETEGVTFEVTKEIKDPIKWFGILVPQSLRQTQQNFVKAITLSTELAGVQMRAETLRRHYRQLLAKKKELKQHTSNSIESCT